MATVTGGHFGRPAVEGVTVLGYNARTSESTLRFHVRNATGCQSFLHFQLIGHDKQTERRYQMASPSSKKFPAGFVYLAAACAVGVLGVVILRHISAGRQPKIVQATASAVAGTWHGDNGATIKLSSDGKFSADHWPSLDDGASYQGNWRIQYLGGNASDAIALSFSPVLEGVVGVPGQVDLVKTRSGVLGLCADDDPDNPCSYGILKKE